MRWGFWVYVVVARWVNESMGDWAWFVVPGCGFLSGCWVWGSGSFMWAQCDWVGDLSDHTGCLADCLGLPSRMGGGACGGYSQCGAGHRATSFSIGIC